MFEFVFEKLMQLIAEIHWFPWETITILMQTIF